MDRPLLMVATFLLLTLAVGLCYSRKTTTLREYAVGNKQFATATLVATMLATGYGGGRLVRTVELIHSLGLYWILILLVSSGCIYWIVRPLALRMGPFMQGLSMSENIGSVFGRYPRIIAALASVYTYIAVLAAQIRVVSQTITLCVGSVDGVDHKITLLATVILIFYSTFGGIRAVTFTDVLQFITFSIVIPLLAWLIFRKMGMSVVESWTFLQSQEKFQFSNICHFDTKLIGILSLILARLVVLIEPSTIQRIYMCSSPVQANRVFLYAGFFDYVIASCIILVGLFVFVSAPALSQEAIWPYIMDHLPPLFKGCVAISLLSMTMSTADSCLNSCSVMVSHDIMGSIRGIKAVPYANRLRFARWATLIIGLSAMLLAKHNTLLQLLHITLDHSIPIVTAPFILIIYGFRGTPRTALIGMVTGAVSICVWNQWIKPIIGNISGAFFCMLANGLAMLVVHYLFPQPEGTGWVELDDELKQIRQAKERKKLREKAERKAFFTKVNMAKLKPNRVMFISAGVYIAVTTFASMYYGNQEIFHLWFICQLLVGACAVGYAVFFFDSHKLPDWFIGRCWFLSVGCGLPLHMLYSWWQETHLLFTLVLALMHWAVMLWLLPLYWSIRGVMVTWVAGCLLYCLKDPVVWPSVALLFMLLSLGIVLFAIILYAKHALTERINQNLYLKHQQKLRKAHKIKKLAYNLPITAPTTRSVLEEDGAILEKIVKNVTQSITFLDKTTPLYKEDFQSILNKFAEWVCFLKKEAKSQNHILLQPTEILLDQLMNQVEVCLASALGRMPRLLIQPQDILQDKIVGDVDQIVYLLVKAVASIIEASHVANHWIRIELYSTHLQYEQGDPLDNSARTPLAFPAIALVISCATTPITALPKVQSYYRDSINDQKPKGYSPLIPECITFEKQTIERIIQAHYGYLEMPNRRAMLLVLPCNVQAIREEMIAKLPMEMGTAETPITPKEEADSMVALMDFHACVSQVAYVDPGVVSEILLLLRRCYGFKRHLSGQLFYVRAAGIAQLVATWIFHSPKPIYASLLYGLVRYTRLPLSYIKANYDMGIFCFVENILSVDKRQELEKSLLYIRNRFKEAIQKEQFSVLYIKLAERLYDLRHAENYTNLEEVKQMAKETLTVDIVLARQYLEPEIATELERAAQQVLVYYKDKTGIDV